MFDFQYWINIFKQHKAKTGLIYNDAITYGVEIVVLNNLSWKVLGVHHLTPGENRGNHNVYIEMLCKQNEREGSWPIHWTQEGRRLNQNAPDVFAGQKPLNELVDIPLNLGMEVSVWPHAGEVVAGLSSNHLSSNHETPGNTIGHHSFFVCFQEVDLNKPVPQPDPLPIPQPKPPTPVIIKVTANLEWLKTLPEDDQGNIIFEIGEE